MAAVQLKRPRDDEQPPADFKSTDESALKRQKSFEDILDILDGDEEEPDQDLSSLITALQEEISSPEHPPAGNFCSETEQDESERMMKHLLEASDDELGIPTTDSGGEKADLAGAGAGDLVVFPAGEGLLWEIEDEAANYYAVLQSELFM